MSKNDIIIYIAAIALCALNAYLYAGVNGMHLLAAFWMLGLALKHYK